MPAVLMWIVVPVLIWIAGGVPIDVSAEAGVATALAQAPGDTAPVGPDMAERGGLARAVWLAIGAIAAAIVVLLITRAAARRRNPRVPH